MSVYIHPLGLCESKDIGARTRVWAFAHVMAKAKIGEDCNICDHVYIENDVVIGDRVTVKSGVQIWDGITVGNDVFIGPNATFTNDRFPRSRQYLTEYPKTVIEDGASIGANSTILPGIRIGRKAMIGAGAVVTKDVPPLAIIVGNPGRIVGYDSGKVSSTAPAVPERKTGSPGLTDARLVSLLAASDLSGDMTSGCFEAQVPFKPARYFVVSNVPNKKVQRESGYRECQQFLVCMNGSVKVKVDDGKVNESVSLDQRNLGLYLPPMIWSMQYNFSSDAVLLVFGSHAISVEDTVCDYEEFLRLKQSL